jgi:hypothetical protein
MSRKVLDVLSKINSLTLKIVVYAMNFIQRTLSSVMNFVANHRVLSLVILGILVFVVMSIFATPEAHAAVQSGAKKILGTDDILSMKGLAKKLSAKDPQTFNVVSTFFDKAVQPGSVENTSQLSGEAKHLADFVFQRVEQANQAIATGGASDQAFGAGEFLDKCRELAKMTREAIIKTASTAAAK